MGLSIWEGNKAKDSVEALQTIAQMQLLEAQYYGLIPISDWNVIKQVLNDGKGPTLLPVGYQITDEWLSTESGTPFDAVWDVVHYDTSGNLVLNWHYSLTTRIPFDAPEAIYYAPSGGLAAGQYYITISASVGNGWIAGQHINFTLNNAMSAGDQLVIDTNTTFNTNPTNGRTWNVYAKGSTVSKDTGVTSNSDTGTELGATHATKAGLSNGQINAVTRTVYGYSRYAQSAIRQYLNSDAIEGNWWTAQNGWDRPPEQLATNKGFLAGCSSDFNAVIATTAVVTDLSTDEATEESKTTDTTYDKVFLPSLENWYILPQLAGEGDEWTYYSELATEAGLSGMFQKQTFYPALIKYSLSSQTSPVNVWLRSLNRISTQYPWYVSGLGKVDYNYNTAGSAGYAGYACTPIPCCPACKILKEA